MVLYRGTVIAETILHAILHSCNINSISIDSAECYIDDDDDDIHAHIAKCFCVISGMFHSKFCGQISSCSFVCIKLLKCLCTVVCAHIYGAQRKCVMIKKIFIEP